MNDGYLPIGRFARLCRLSVKQLRHYDQLGLLAPAHVDPDTGYRYYRAGQAREALLIGLLRSLDVPLVEVGRVLAGEAGVLGGVRDRMEADLARRRRTLATLDRVLADGLPRAEVSLVSEPARRVVMAREVADQEEIGAVTSACVVRLIEATGPPTSPLVGLFPLDLSPRVEVAVAAEAEDGPDILPGGVYASATHIGPYDQLALTGHALFAWVTAHGHTPLGPLREVYISAPAATPPEQLVTHLMIKLEDPE
ncbi:MerR family transcriptional regulator [Actinoallomurus sp. CA-150999]|uniref:MerR family transcriptional regulator n=1 Tax=Actinoallomurus sp. CA-150999 TaxID=3239887 RepID=UPI003D8F500E